MASPRKPDPATTDRSTRLNSDRQVAVISRGWLIVWSAMLVVPWLIAGAIYVRQTAAPVTGKPAPSATVDTSRSASSGPWGRLTMTPVVVSPPLEYVPADWGRTLEPDQWYFPGTSADVLEAFLASTGLTSEQMERLRSAVRPHAAIRGLVLTPDPDLVWSLGPDVRARLYTQLARTSLNFDQANSFRFLGPSVDSWLGGSLISPETRRQVEPLIYRDGDFLNFADPEAIRSAIDNPEELRRLAKALLRQATLLVRLSVGGSSEVEPLADYWGIGGRRLDLRPLLESVAEAGPEASIDIVHLLPTFARHHLYRYPRMSTADFSKPLLANCLWTALNFFRAQPDDRYLDVNVALDTLKRDYYLVQHGFQLGDIVGFVDEEGDLFHVAVYLADGLVFTKNGTSPMAPWTIVTIDYLKGYYQRVATDMRLMYHRRNDL